MPGARIGGTGDRTRRTRDWRQDPIRPAAAGKATRPHKTGVRRRWPVARPQGPGRKTPCPVAQKAGGSWHEDKTQGRVGQETRGHGHVRQEFNRVGDVVHEARHKAPAFCDTRGRGGRSHGTSHRRQDPRLHERAVGRRETGPRTQRDRQDAGGEDTR